MDSPARPHLLSDAPFVGVPWLSRFRWMGLLGITLLWLSGPALHFSPPPLAMLGVVATGALTNLLLASRKAEPDDRLIAAVLVLDTVLLTLMLAVSGGDSNPFVLLYVFPVAVGAMSVRPSLTWLLFAASALGYGSLFVLAPSDLHHHGPQAMRAHLAGMFIAYVSTSALMVFALGRARASRSRAEQEIANARAMSERAERLTALATLAAGAAHELGSPLSTILVACGELQRRTRDDRSLQDLDLIREEVSRCQEIVTLLSADVGAGMGEGARIIGARDLLDEALESMDRIEGRSIAIEAPDDEVELPVAIAAQLVRRLVGNAIDASPASSVISVSAIPEGDRLNITVSDKGSGMSPEVLARATEPFFSTKPQGQGRGLGLFFVESVTSQLGGTMTITSTLGAGTTVRLSLPCARSRTKEIA